MALFFKDIIGQKGVIEQLRRCVDENRLAHALLITGPQGNGKLAIAVALANYLLCGKQGADACGMCPACVKLGKFKEYALFSSGNGALFVASMDVL